MKYEAHSGRTVIVGDNLRTDILAGFRAGLETFWCSGVSAINDIDSMPFAQAGFTFRRWTDVIKPVLCLR